MSVSVVPPSGTPGLAKAYPADCTSGASPNELKRLAIEFAPRTGLSKREIVKRWDKLHKCGRTTVRAYLDPRALDRCPPKRFVQMLVNLADWRSLELAEVGEVASK